ncbi:hypothetical protein [Aeromicrobium duanguangcaii]|uniref:Uncharacterized protein n=1 Tax=Aeromicrobium duanguangcaii TaxID=2968086 RepID=A0ABY5KCA9_9ACTN|nr:hypothetical protein [Aeromicrobium duanguangcaii]MCD9155248.1 hypothetical protein [Aeromicrobium duanguangcaii]MCL3838599.1 hypothetical protein [Aeromicrobium duanguangcaii]UUI68101.1 hypothetical protein NP095_12940 [Aeromicrobium duanguangcaii]
MPAEEREEAAKRARRERAARLLGDLLPSTTRDERSEGWGDDRGGSTRDDELRRDVPPHHGKD